ncbi:MAG: periplasmic heavy metal sensor [Pseudomonadota bacterium]
MVDTPTPDPMPKKRRVPWSKVLLVASLAVNLLVIGLIAGTILGKGPRDRNPVLRDLGYGPLIAALPSETKREMTAALRSNDGPIRENRRALRRDFETFLDLLRAETVDEARLNEVISRKWSRISERREIGQELLVRQILAMTPGERVAYADKLDRRLRNRGPRPPKPSE